MKRPSSLEWEATTAAIPAPVAAAVPRPGYRRISALEAATAMAVIITCLVALAVMTGVLPMPARISTPLQAMAPAPTASAASAAAPTAANAANAANATTAAPFTADAAGRLPMQAEPGQGRSTLPAATTSSPEPPGAIAADGGATVPWPSTQAQVRTPLPVATADLSQNTFDSSMQKPKERASRQARHHQRRSLANHGRPGTQAHTGKTREQVIEELLQAKRDGSYSAAAELYR